MKVMIDVPSHIMALLAQTPRMFRYDGNEEAASEMDIFVNKLRETIDAWADPSVDEVSHYPGPEKEAITLGKQLIFDPHTKLSDNLPGLYLAFPHNSVLTHRFAIGKDHTGILIIPTTSWMALNELPSTPKNP